ncbi:hypothetical protein F442_18831 [Phytophthora nicotianae P10297]|uniref:Uncharacterized protein n=1 Tax=Phytophthora nicotianae P10297 TaxID=1317064 RepID=W2YBU2_PHYNI|nr:hypothetical protein F442_18831 [Phytophthora nicotianae P10297]
MAEKRHHGGERCSSGRGFCAREEKLQSEPKSVQHWLRLSATSGQRSWTEMFIAGPLTKRGLVNMRSDGRIKGDRVHESSNPSLFLSTAPLLYMLPMYNARNFGLVDNSKISIYRWFIVPSP